MSSYKTLQITPLGTSVALGRAPINYRLKQAWVEQERRASRLSPSRSASSSPVGSSRGSSSRRGSVSSSSAGRSWAGSASASSSSQGSGSWRSLRSIAPVEPELGGRSTGGRSTGGRSTGGSTGNAPWSGASTGAQSAGGWAGASATSSQRSAQAQGGRAQQEHAQEEYLELPSTLVAALRLYRTQKSRALQVPAYTIFSDATLNAIVEARPVSREGLLSVKGVGPSTWAKYGPEIIQIVCEY